MDLDLKVVSKEINEILWRNHQTLSVAESCTSGRIASVITAVPGSSQYFKGGVIAYANEVYWWVPSGLLWLLPLTLRPLCLKKTMVVTRTWLRLHQPLCTCFSNC